jgi:hypothetical protein
MEGKHYKMDFVTFSHLLGLNGTDCHATELIEYEDVEMEEYQHMYLDGYPADGQTVYLKPYFYVLNNILRQIWYPKVGDSTYLHDDSQKVLDRLLMISRSSPSVAIFRTRFMTLLRIL